MVQYKITIRFGAEQLCGSNNQKQTQLSGLIMLFLSKMANILFCGGKIDSSCAGLRIRLGTIKALLIVGELKIRVGTYYILGRLVSHRFFRRGVILMYLGTLNTKIKTKKICKIGNNWSRAPKVNNFRKYPKMSFFL